MITAKGTLPHAGIEITMKALGIRQMIEIESLTKDNPTERMMQKMAASLCRISEKELAEGESLALIESLDMTDWTCASELYDRVNDVDKAEVVNFTEAVVLTA